MEERKPNRWIKTCTLRDEEWEKLDKIMDELHCPNISFFVRMIANGYIQVTGVGEGDKNGNMA